MIPIYKSEIDDGLEHQIQASASLGILADVVTFVPTESQQEKFQRLVEKAIAEANPNQFDLYYLKSILVSVGWNKNDDVFPYMDTWNARNTPVDKPFNYMHDMADIIGHITSSVVISNNEIVLDDTPLDDVPDVFDIVVGSVLYKKWPDETLQARMDKIIEEIPHGKWKVSMECLFSNFDYAIITPKGDNKVIRRNEASAFLTKYLRRYGGTGEYEGHRIGRLLRNFTFSGKGLVDKPANPRSDVIGHSNTEETKVFVSANEALVESLQSEEKNMTVEYTEEQYKFLKEELDAVKADIVKKDVEIENLKKELAAAKEASESNVDKVLKEAQASHASTIQDKDEQIADLSEKLDKSEKSLAETNKKLEEIEAEAAKAARLARVLERDVTEEKAKALVDKFADVSDEMFDELVAALPEKKEEGTEASEETEEDEASEEDQTTANNASEEVNSAEVNSNDTATGSTEPEEVEETLQKSVASWIGGTLRSTAKLQKSEK